MTLGPSGPPTSGDARDAAYAPAETGDGYNAEALAGHVRYLADHLGARAVGTEEAARASRYLRDAVARLGFFPELAAFSTKGLNGRAQLLGGDGRPIPCRAAHGSPATRGALRGLPRLLPGTGRQTWSAALEPPGTVALCPVGFDDEREAVAAATRRRAVAALLFRERAPELYSAAIFPGAAPIPCATIRPADAFRLAEEKTEVELTVETEHREVMAANIVVGVGKEGRRPLLFLANYDSRVGAPGAYRNASGVAALLGLLARLRDWTEHQVLVGFLDGEEVNGAGSRHCRDVLEATGMLPSVRGVVYVSGVGLNDLAVISGSSAQTTVRLARTAQRAAAEEGFPPWAGSATAPGVGSLPRLWRCPVIALAGPRLAMEHTGLDRPDLVDPRCLARVALVLERLARMPQSGGAVVNYAPHGKE